MLRYSMVLVVLLGVAFVGRAAVAADDENEKRGKQTAKSSETSEAEASKDSDAADKKPAEDRPREGRRPPPPPPPRSDSPGGPPWHDRLRPPGEFGRDGGHGPGRDGPHHGSPHGHHHRFGEMRQHDPEMAELYERDAELDRESFELGEQYRHASGEKRDELMTKLKTTVLKHFEVRQERRELELKRLEEQLDRLRSSVKKRTEQQDEIIKQRVDELIGKPEETGF